MNIHPHCIVLFSFFIFNTTSSHPYDPSKEYNEEGKIVSGLSREAFKLFGPSIKKYKYGSLNTTSQAITSFINRFVGICTEIKNSPFASYNLHLDLAFLFISGENALVSQLDERYQRGDYKFVTNMLGCINDFLGILIRLMNEVKNEKEEIISLCSKMCAGAANVLIHFDEVVCSLSKELKEYYIVNQEKMVLSSLFFSKSVHETTEKLFTNSDDLRFDSRLLHFAFHYPFLGTSCFSFNDISSYSSDFSTLKKIVTDEFTNDLKGVLWIGDALVPINRYFPLYQTLNVIEKHILLKIWPYNARGYFDDLIIIQSKVFDKVCRNSYGLSLGTMRGLQTIKSEAMKECAHAILVRDRAVSWYETTTFEDVCKIMGLAEEYLTGQQGYEDYIKELKNNSNNPEVLKQLLSILEAAIYYRSIEQVPVVLNKKIKDKKVDLFLDLSDERTLNPFVEAKDKDKLIACCTLSMDEIAHNPDSLKMFQEKLEYLVQNAGWYTLVGVYYINPLSDAIKNEIEKNCTYKSVTSFRHAPETFLHKIFIQ